MRKVVNLTKLNSVYKVSSTSNTLDPRVGDTLRESDVAALLRLAENPINNLTINIK